MKIIFSFNLELMRNSQQLPYGVHNKLISEKKINMMVYLAFGMVKDQEVTELEML